MKKLGRRIVFSVFVLVALILLLPILFPLEDEVSQDSPVECEAPAACWGDLHYDAAATPCWRAIEMAAQKLGRWEWAGIGRLSTHRSLPNGSIYYYGDRIEVMGPDGARQLHHYTCVYNPTTGEVSVPVLSPGPLPES